MAASLSPHQAGLDSGLGVTARDTGTALVIVAANIILSARTGLTSGLAPVTLSAVTLAVVSGYGGAARHALS
ncbi:hypothetical protein [Streptomyces aureocirculatus]|uniref:hypothetical protein n=1 Tax=Streptomyces aureocirculatus TaxID=67275 RepID=UPI0004C89227|nr:hypothetical protein [Streptomyces aureocirculatus]